MQPKLTTAFCPSCDNPFAGKFCASCGEKQLSHHEFSVKHFIAESIESLTHFDGKFWKTLKALFLKPGMLTLNFEAGKRVLYMRPFQLFIVANLLFFIIVRGTNLFASSLSNYYNSSLYSWFGTKDAVSRKATTEEGFIALASLFNERIITQSKSFIFLFIPLLALACWLLFFRKRKPFTLHLVFATHFFAFILLYFLAFVFLIETPVHYLLHATESRVYDAFLGIFSICVFATYQVLAARRFYKSSWSWSIISGIVISFVFFASLVAYRLLLFYKIIYTLPNEAGL